MSKRKRVGRMEKGWRKDGEKMEMITKREGAGETYEIEHWQLSALYQSLVCQRSGYHSGIRVCSYGPAES